MPSINITITETKIERQNKSYVAKQIQFQASGDSYCALLYKKDGKTQEEWSKNNKPITKVTPYVKSIIEPFFPAIQKSFETMAPDLNIEEHTAVIELAQKYRALPSQDSNLRQAIKNSFQNIYKVDASQEDIEAHKNIQREQYSNFEHYDFVFPDSHFSKILEAIKNNIDQSSKELTAENSIKLIAATVEANKDYEDRFLVYNDDLNISDPNSVLTYDLIWTEHLKVGSILDAAIEYQTKQLKQKTREPQHKDRKRFSLK